VNDDQDERIWSKLAHHFDALPVPRELIYTRSTRQRRQRFAARELEGFVLVVLVAAVLGLAVFRTSPSGAASASGPAGPHLRTAEEPAGTMVTACPAALQPGVLEGDANDPWVAWVVSPHGVRVNVIWPAKFTATFNPNLSLLGPRGDVVAHAGQQVLLTGGLGSGESVFGACIVDLAPAP
jgi:hypothetical protein